VVVWEAFETVILPRRVARSRRLTALFYRLTWGPWATAAQRIRNAQGRETFLSFFGPLSLLMLLAIWAESLVLGFALLHWGLGSEMTAPEGSPGFGAVLYHSGVTFFTLGFGDVVPINPLGRGVAVVEAGTGFAFLAMIIGYLPSLNSTFSRREINVSLLDARAGSPPSAVELLRRHAEDDETMASLRDLLAEWERWAADLLESHLSFPVLAYFRSQHEQQSWVAALTTILDTCAIVISRGKGPAVPQARLTFAMASHAAGDLGQIFRTAFGARVVGRPPPPPPAEQRAQLGQAGLPDADDEATHERLAQLRRKYEPYVEALSSHLLMPLPPWTPAESDDIWRTTAWGFEDARARGRAATDGDRRE